MNEKTVKLRTASVRFSNSLPLVLIAGPCVIEKESQVMAIAGKLKELSCELGISLVFKASYDKANRSSVRSFRGPGIKNGLAILSRVKRKFRFPILTDVHREQDVAAVSKVADILQIPAFLSRQTDLILECARTGLPVNVKKGQFLAPEDMQNVVKKIESVKNNNIILTERGSSFGYHNLVVDMRSIEIMKSTGYPVVFDATHSVQLPGGLKESSGGRKEFIEPLSKAAAAVGIAGIFVEVHENPEKALSDGPNSLSIAELRKLLKKVIKIDKLVKQ